MSPATWFRLLGLSALVVASWFAVPALTQDAKKGKRWVGSGPERRGTAGTGFVTNGGRCPDQAAVAAAGGGPGDAA